MSRFLLSGPLLLCGMTWTAAPVQADATGHDYPSRQLSAPEVRVLWLTPDLKQRAETILGHPYAGLRVRYWVSGTRAAWVLEEVGKEQPITAGFTVANGHIEDAQVLAYRESRGGEVQQHFFTRQFNGASLKAGDALDARVDGITGATLSVRAMQRMARLALLFDSRRGS